MAQVDKYAQHYGKTYLGDGVYVAKTTSGDLILTTENGVETNNTIYIEPNVARSLVTIIERYLNGDY